ncbi:MAG: ATP-binding protein [Trichlorobacter sp.]
MTFRWKLFFSYALLALVMAGALYVHTNRLLEGRLVDESRQYLLNEARLAQLTYKHLSGSQKPQKIAEQLGGATRSRVTLISPDGKVLADSDVRADQVDSLENHRSRPEVQQALTAGSGSSLRYSDTLRVTMLYVAVAGNDTDGTVLRLALPLEYLEAAKRSLHTLLGGAGVALLLLALIFSVLLSNLTSRPLRAMSEAAARFGAGERGVRMPVQGTDEVGYLGQVLNQMATRLEDQMDNLASERQRLNAILHGMGEGVMVLNAQGVITLVNPAFRNQLSLEGEVVGKSLVEICRHPDLLQAYDQQRATGGEVMGEVALPASGKTLSTHWVPLVEHQGTVAVFHDISDLKRIEAIRRDFVANASHELRTPVAVIKGYAETLLDGGLQDNPERSQQFVSIIASHAERLTNLINDILTLSKLESKETALELFPLDVAGMLRKTRLLMEEHARQQGLSLTVTSPETLPRVMADHGRLEQVLLNLLDNAIKYTPAGGSVTIGAEQRGRQIAITVSDTGVGIPPKDLSRIFERFYRVDEARSREQGGTGLGLAIVKHIVQLHGGEVRVDSEPGKGSSFTVLLKQA